MKNGKPFPIPVKAANKPAKRYNCLKCPAYCCTYSEIEVTARDVERLARHFGLTYAQAEDRFTKLDAKGKVRMLRHRKDKIFDSTCMLLDQEKRRCTVYEARPGVCRKYPDSNSCGYYDFLRFEREQQDDQEWVALT
jgi:Fe-S-cluster containining protein